MGKLLAVAVAGMALTLGSAVARAASAPVAVWHLDEKSGSSAFDSVGAANAVRSTM